MWLCTKPTQRNRFPLPRHTLLASAASSRSFWWSPKATPSVQETSLSKEQSIAPEPVSPVEFATEPPAEASALAESTGITEATPLPDPSILPDIPAEVLSAIPLPLQYGDLAALGLAGWSPAGLCRWGMEIIQVSTGMPWIWAIVAATFATRLFLFPFQVKTMRNTAALAPHQDALAALRQEIMNAQKSGDPLAMQQAILKQRMVYERIGVSMGSMALMPFVQLPVTLGMFFAIKKLCDLPLEQLKWSGVDILPDLTAADPTHVLPVLCAVGKNIQLSVSSCHVIALVRTNIICVKL